MPPTRGRRCPRPCGVHWACHPDWSPGRGKVVAADFRPNDVVVLRPAELEQSELGLRPPQAILALGIAKRLRESSSSSPSPNGRPVVHTDDVPVAEHPDVVTDVAFVRLVKRDRDLLRHRLLQFQRTPCKLSISQSSTTIRAPRADIGNGGWFAVIGLGPERQAARRSPIGWPGRRRPEFYGHVKATRVRLVHGRVLCWKRVGGRCCGRSVPGRRPV